MARQRVPWTSLAAMLDVLHSTVSVLTPDRIRYPHLQGRYLTCLYSMLVERERSSTYPFFKLGVAQY